jgi:hypothetical protein
MNRIDWLPVDLLSDMLVEAMSRKPAMASTTDRSSYNSGPVQAAEFLHFVNPHHVEWSNIVSELAAHMAPRPRIVSYDTWLQALVNASEQDADEVADVPAIKLLDFFQDIGRCDAKRPVFSTSLTEKACSSLQTCGPVSVAWMKQWMKQWGLDVREGGGSGIEGFASNPSPSDCSGQALLVNLMANDMLKIPHQIDSGPVAIPVARRSMRPVSTIA